MGCRFNFLHGLRKAGGNNGKGETQKGESGSMQEERLEKTN